jgi:uncharacterized membrane protein
MPSTVVAGEVLVLGLVLLAMVSVLGIGLLLYRRRYFAGLRNESTGFTLADVREMYKNGQLSDEEYERMRKSVLAASINTEDRTANSPPVPMDEPRQGEC